MPLPFAALQTIGRKIYQKQLSEAPVGFIAYDLWNTRVRISGTSHA